jgi:histidinol-phosphate aminotransferase
MAYFRACVQAMSAYVPGEQPPAGARVVKLNTNENPYPPSPRVADAVAGELSGGGARLRLYSDPSAAELRRAAARAVGFSLEHVLAGNGSDELLAMVMRALVDPGDTVAYPYPNYVLYETLAAAQGARVETVDYPADFTLPSALFGCDAKVVFVATPNSPSGIAHGTGDLQRLAESLPRGVLVIDEAYADFARSSAVELASRLPNVIVTIDSMINNRLTFLLLAFFFFLLLPSSSSSMSEASEADDTSSLGPYSSSSLRQQSTINE